MFWSESLSGFQHIKRERTIEKGLITLRNVEGVIQEELSHLREIVSFRVFSAKDPNL